MAEPSILFVKPKAISFKDKRTLSQAGVIVIEIENPADAKFVRAGTELSGGALLQAAAEAIASTTGYNSPREAFGKAVCAAIERELSQGASGTRPEVLQA